MQIQTQMLWTCKICSGCRPCCSMEICILARKLVSCLPFPSGPSFALPMGCLKEGEGVSCPRCCRGYFQNGWSFLYIFLEYLPRCFATFSGICLAIFGTFCLTQANVLYGFRCCASFCHVVILFRHFFFQVCDSFLRPSLENAPQDFLWHNQDPH